MLLDSINKAKIFCCHPELQEWEQRSKQWSSRLKKKKNRYADWVKLKRVWNTPAQPNRLYACSKAAAGIFEGSFFPKKTLIRSSLWMHACMHCPWAAPECNAAGDAHRLHLPLLLLCAASWETRYCQAHGPYSKAPWHGGRGEGTGWKRKEKRRWRHSFRCTSGSWRGERNGIQIRELKMRKVGQEWFGEEVRAGWRRNPGLRVGRRVLLSERQKGDQLTEDTE